MDAARVLADRLKDFLGGAAFGAGATKKTFRNQCADNSRGCRTVDTHVVNKFGFSDASPPFVNKFKSFVERKLVALVEKNDSEKNQDRAAKHRAGAFQRFFGYLAHHIHKYKQPCQYEYEPDYLE